MARKKTTDKEGPVSTNVPTSLAEAIALLRQTETPEPSETDLLPSTAEIEEGEGDEGELPPEDRLPTVPQLCVAIALLAVVLGYPTVMQFIGKPAQAIATHAETKSTEVATAEKVDPFSDMTLGATAAYVWDVSAQKALYTKNAQAQLPLASLTKLMTALVAFETYGADATVPITLKAISQEGESGFKEGGTWKSKDLLDFTLMTSSNDGAYALAAAAGKSQSGTDVDAEHSFVKRMNAKAEEIGLTQTYFTNPTGLDTSESQSGSYGSARDMAFLMQYIIEHAPAILEHTTEKTTAFTDLEGTVFPAANTNESIEKIAGSLGSKTGYTVLAGGNLVVAFNVGLNHPIVVAVLGSSREGRFADVETLRARVLASYHIP